MVQMALPNGAVVDFEDASDEEIQTALSVLKSEQPELFEEAAPAPDLATASYDELQSYYQGTERAEGAQEIAPDFTPTVDGQVTSASDRYEFGKADTVAEEEQFLTNTYGPGSFGKDNQGRYYLVLDNISPEIKEAKGLPESGTMWFNKPGGGFLGLFDMPDVIEFVGKYRGELVGGTAAALATTGVGLIPASLLIGAGAGVGKGLDELQEYAEGTQLQEPDEIYGDVATSAAFNSIGNVVVGGVLKGLGKLVRGPGNPDAQVISDLMDQGLSASKAKAAAIQMQRTSTRDAIKEGARPTVSEATGKAVLGRLQAIHEGIFPNRTAARSNRKYVENLFTQYRNGELSGDALGAALDQNAKEVSRLITNAMKDPDQAIKLANQQLRNVIEEEMNLLKTLYTTGDETAAAFQNEMTRMVRLWQNNSKVLYQNADDLLDNAKLFKADELKNLVKQQARAPLAEEQGLLNNPVYQYIQNKTGDFTIGELQALRSTIQNSRSGSLVGDVTDNQLKGLSDKLDEMFNGAEFRINNILQEARAGTLTYEMLGRTRPTATNISEMGFRVGPEEVLTTAEAKEVAKRFAEGLDKFKAANQNYKDGAEIFKTGAMNMLNKNIKEGFFADLSSVAEAVIQNNKPELLRNYLKGVTPSPTIRGAMQSIPETQWSQMANAARQGNITEVNRLLGANFPELKGGKVGEAAEKTLRDIGIGLRPPSFLERLPENDPFRKRVLSELAETFQIHADDAAAAAAGAAHKNVSRQALASTWLKTAAQKADDSGVFNPVAFRRSFDKLGKEVQSELFGQAEAQRLNSVLKDFALVAPDQVKGGLRFGTTAPESITNSNMRNIVQRLQADVAEAQTQSSDALFQAVKAGRIDDAEGIIQAAVKDPKLLDSLIREVPEYALEQPFGLRDAVMARIVRESFPKGITEDAVVSGAWRDGMAASIANLNQRGSLNRILGRDVVQDLVKISKLPVGDMALKGKGGLASSTYAAGIGLAVLTNPAAALPSLAGIYLSGRILRSELFLNLVTRPNIRAGELKAGIRGLSESIMAQARADGVNITKKEAVKEAKKQLGDLSVLRLRLKQLVGSESRIIGATAASGSVDADTRREVGERISGAAEAVGPALQDVQQQASSLAASGQGNPLRQLELNKLLGITP